MSQPYPTRLLSLDEPGERWRPRTRASLEAAVEAARPGDVVLVSGRQPSSSPNLLEVIRGLHARGASAWLVSVPGLLARPERVASLAAAGLQGWYVLLRAVPAPGEAELAALTVAQDAGLGVALATVEPSQPAFWDLASDRGLALLALRSLVDERALAPDASDDAALSSWLATGEERGVACQVFGWLTPWGATAPSAPPVASATVRRIVAHGFVPASARSGLCTPAGLSAREVRGLAAAGAPSVNLPPCLGGTGTTPDDDAVRADACGPCPAAACRGSRSAPGPRRSWLSAPASARVHLVIPADADAWLAVSALPALAEALRARGAQVTVTTAWHTRWHPTALAESVPQVARWRRLPTPQLPPRDRLAHPAWFSETPARVAAVDRALWARLDLAGADVVIVPSLRAAARLRTAARVVAIDVGPQSRVGANVEVWSPRPDQADVLHALVTSGDVRWLPLPVHLAHHAAGPAACGAQIAGVDAGISRLADDTRALLVSPADSPDEAIAAIGRAFAAGRPVIAPATPWSRPHVRHEIDGLLYPPDAGPGAALATLVDATVARLAAGAARSAHTASVERLADQLLHGAPPAVAMFDSTQSPAWRAW